MSETPINYFTSERDQVSDYPKCSNKKAEITFYESIVFFPYINKELFIKRGDRSKVYIVKKVEVNEKGIFVSGEEKGGGKKIKVDIRDYQPLGRFLPSMEDVREHTDFPVKVAIVTNWMDD